MVVKIKSHKHMQHVICPWH